MKRRTGPARVLVVCAVNGHGGPIKSIATVLKHLDDTVAVVCTQVSPHPDHRSEVELEADATIDIPRPRGVIGLLRCQLVLLCRGWRVRRTIDVIHANGLTEVAVSLPLAVLAQVPMVVWIHNYERPRAFRLIEPLIDVVGRRWIWLAVSPVAALQVHHVVPTIVPNPVDPDVVSHDRVHSSHVRVVYFAGTDRPYKGFDMLPTIISSVPSTTVRWSIFTSPPYSSPDERCQASWRELLALQGTNVVIRGRETNVASVFREADLILSPSRQESFNRVIAEGVANGVPFVASDIPAHRALVGSTSAGCLFSLDDPKTAGAIIERFATDHEFRLELQSNAAASSHLFDADTIATEVAANWNAAATRALAPSTPVGTV